MPYGFGSRVSSLGFGLPCPVQASFISWLSHLKNNFVFEAEMIRDVNPLPAPCVPVCTQFAMIGSRAAVVFDDPLLVVALVPVPARVRSNVLTPLCSQNANVRINRGLVEHHPDGIATGRHLTRGPLTLKLESRSSRLRRELHWAGGAS